MDDPRIDSVDPKKNASTPPAEPVRNPNFVPEIPPAVEGHRETTTHCKPDQTPVWKMLVETAAVFLGICVAYIYGGQLAVMRWTLEQMRQSNAEATNQVWQAIGNINWMARSMDSSQKQAQAAMDNSDRQNQQSIAATLKAAHETNQLAKQAMDAQTRPWVGLVDLALTLEKINGTAQRSSVYWQYLINIRNYGNSPAKRIVHNELFKFDAGHTIKRTWKKLDVCKAAEEGSLAFDRQLPTVIDFPQQERSLQSGYGFDSEKRQSDEKWMVVCVTYLSASNEAHYTQALYHVIPKDGKNPIPYPGISGLKYFPTDHFELFDTDAN
jgi:hypothetical protein